MADQLINLVFWDHHSRNTYMYGTRLSFRDDGCVSYRNTLAPSGTVIRSWSSRRNFQADRIEPQLPILMEGRQYHLRAFMQSAPENTTLLRLNFYSRQQDLIEYRIFEEPEGDFTAPEKVDYWTLQLVAGGVEELLFHHIEVHQVELNFYKLSGSEVYRNLIQPGEPGTVPGELNLLLLRRQSSTVHVPPEEITGRIPGMVMLTGAEAEWLLSREVPLPEALAREGRIPRGLHPVRINFIGYDRTTDSLCRRAAAAMEGTGYTRLCHVIEADRMVQPPAEINEAAAVFADRRWILEKLPEILYQSL